jgi:predicted GNAT family N-acyltransferase
MKEGNVIGFCFWDYPKTAGKGCCFEFLLVDEAERGKKYGNMLMDDFLAWTDANGRTEIKIQFDNTRMLRKFYTKYGFKDCGDVEDEDADCPLNVWYRGL